MGLVYGQKQQAQWHQCDVVILNQDQGAQSWASLYDNRTLDLSGKWEVLQHLESCRRKLDNHLADRL